MMRKKVISSLMVLLVAGFLSFGFGCSGQEDYQDFEQPRQSESSGPEFDESDGWPEESERK